MGDKHVKPINPSIHHTISHYPLTNIRPKNKLLLYLNPHPTGPRPTTPFFYILENTY